MNVTGNAYLTKTYKDGRSSVFNGKYDRAKNLISGFFSSRGGDSDMGEFVFALEVPEMTVQFARDGAAEEAPRREAVSEYMTQREKIMKVPLGTTRDDIMTTWFAIYVYGSGRSDTLKDIMLRFTGTSISGSGTDVAGDYTWKGSINGNEVTLVKDYPGSHSITHVGQFNAARDTIKGNWTITGTRASGGFQLSEVAERRSNAESMPVADLERLSLNGGASSAASSALGKSKLAGPLSASSQADTVWSVVYVYASGRSDELKDCTLRFVNGSITGSGEDAIGTFTWSGKLGPGGACELVKAYEGKHSVAHTGTYDGTVFKGSWAVPNTRAVGGFHMTEKVERRRLVDARLTNPLASFPDAVVCTFVFDYRTAANAAMDSAEVQLRVTDGSISGRGADNVGECRWSGAVNQQGTSTLTKSYTGKHDVVHTVAYNAATNELTGTWELKNSGAKASGNVVITEKIGQRRLAAAAGKDRAPEAAQPASNAMAFPSVERAELGKAHALPALTQARGELITFWRGSQVISRNTMDIDEFSMVFSNCAEFNGKGKDQAAGDFDIAGTFNPQTGDVSLVKTYKGGMKVNLVGKYDTAVSAIRGTLDMVGTKAKGEFEFIEITEKRVG